MPAAVMMIGTIIGEMRRLMIGSRHGMCGRLRPSAARVPSRVASKVAETPMTKLFLIEWIHCSLASMSRYQRSE